MLSRTEEEEDLQRLLNDPYQHTPTNPFCPNPSCSCRKNELEVQILKAYEQAGLATATDVENIFQGRTIR